MAVPSSGELSLRGIRHEFYNSNYSGTTSFSDVGLTSLSIGDYGAVNTANASANRPDGSTPHEMSEFYSYDHDYIALTSFSTLVSTSFGICGNTLTGTAWHDGSGTLPANGDRIYSNSSGTSTHNNSYLTTNASIGGVTTSSTGYVNGTFSCGRK